MHDILVWSGQLSVGVTRYVRTEPITVQ